MGDVQVESAAPISIPSSNISPQVEESNNKQFENELDELEKQLQQQAAINNSNNNEASSSSSSSSPTNSEKDKKIKDKQGKEKKEKKVKEKQVKEKPEKKEKPDKKEKKEKKDKNEKKQSKGKAKGGKEPANDGTGEDGNGEDVVEEDKTNTDNKSKGKEKEIPSPKEKEPTPSQQITRLKELANTELWNKNYTKALEYFNEAFQIDPTNMEIPLSKAAAYNSSGLYQDAIRECQLSIELGNNKSKDIRTNGFSSSNEDVEKEEELTKIQLMQSKAHARMSASYMGISDYRTSKQCIAKAIETYNCSEFEEMLKMINELIAISSGDLMERVNEAKQMYINKKYNEAIKIYSYILAIDKNNNILFANRAMAYIKLKHFKHAIKDCERAIDIQTKDEHYHYLAYYAKGNAYYGLKRYHDAMLQYQLSLKHDTNNTHHDMLVKKIEKSSRMMNMGPNEASSSSSKPKSTKKKTNKKQLKESTSSNITTTTTNNNEKEKVNNNQDTEKEVETLRDTHDDSNASPSSFATPNSRFSSLHNSAALEMGVNSINSQLINSTAVNPPSPSLPQPSEEPVVSDTVSDNNDLEEEVELKASKDSNANGQEDDNEELDVQIDNTNNDINNNDNNNDNNNGDSNDSYIPNDDHEQQEEEMNEVDGEEEEEEIRKPAMAM